MFEFRARKKMIQGKIAKNESRKTKTNKVITLTNPAQHERRLVSKTEANADCFRPSIEPLSDFDMGCLTVCLLVRCIVSSVVTCFHRASKFF